MLKTTLLLITILLLAYSQDIQNGQDGQDGQNGQDGQDGQDGKTIEFTADQLNNRTLQLEGDSCQKFDPKACCFKGDVKLTVDSDGEQTNEECEGSITVYPAAEFEGKNTIGQSYSVTNKNRNLKYNLFNSINHEGTEDAKATLQVMVPIGKDEGSTVNQSLSFIFNPSNIESPSNSNTVTYSPSIQFMRLISIINILILLL